MEVTIKHNPKVLPSLTTTTTVVVEAEEVTIIIVITLLEVGLHTAVTEAAGIIAASTTSRMEVVTILMATRCSTITNQQLHLSRWWAVTATSMVQVIQAAGDITVAATVIMQQLHHSNTMFIIAQVAVAQTAAVIQTTMVIAMVTLGVTMRETTIACRQLLLLKHSKVIMVTTIQTVKEVVMVSSLEASFTSHPILIIVII
jgi:hypothetical protein